MWKGGSGISSPDVLLLHSTVIREENCFQMLPRCPRWSGGKAIEGNIRSERWGPT